MQIASQKEVKDVINALPAPVRELAKQLPVLMEMKPRPFEIKDGIDADTLGLFSGDTFAESASSAQPAPTQIILFMENIWEFAGHDSTAFREEIRRTYLHELGHYLGLDEDDLFDRDLD